MATKSCGTCHAFHPTGEACATGECRKNPPVPVVITDDEGSEVMTVWPEVDPDEYCHQWEQAQ